MVQVQMGLAQTGTIAQRVSTVQERQETLNAQVQGLQQGMVNAGGTVAQHLETVQGHQVELESKVLNVQEGVAQVVNHIQQGM